MASNPYVNKVVFGNQTVMDISDTDAEEADVVEGKTFYKKSGARATGTASYYSPNDTASTDIDDDDFVPFYDDSASAKKNSLWSNIKSVLKTFFDNYYHPKTTVDNVPTANSDNLVKSGGIKTAIDAKCDNSVVAPVENGATASQAYAKGEHFIRDGAFCTAKTAIALGASFTLNTNYTAGTISDDLNPQKISTGTSPSLTLASGVTSNGTAADNVYAIKKGNIVFLKLRVYMSLSAGAWNLVATLPSGYYPAGQNIEFTANNIDLDVQYNARFETDGRIQIYNPSTASSNKRISIALTYILE